MTDSKEQTDKASQDDKRPNYSEDENNKNPTLFNPDININPGINADPDMEKFRAQFDLSGFNTTKSSLDRLEDLNTRLHQAVIFGALSILEQLLSEGADVNSRDSHGLTPLHKTLNSMWSTEPISILIAAGADIALSDKDGRTPLHYAVSVVDKIQQQKYITYFNGLEHDLLDALVRDITESIFLFSWEPPEAADFSKSSDEILVALTNTMVLIWLEERVVATTCGAYVQDLFGTWGLQFLSYIASALASGNGLYSEFKEEINIFSFSVTNFIL